MARSEGRAAIFWLTVRRILRSSRVIGVSARASRNGSTKRAVDGGV